MTKLKHASTSDTRFSIDLSRILKDVLVAMNRRQSLLDLEPAFTHVFQDLGIADLPRVDRSRLAR